MKYCCLIRLIFFFTIRWNALVLCLFVPFYDFYFAITRWSEAGKAMGLQIFAGVIVITAQVVGAVHDWRDERGGPAPAHVVPGMQDDDGFVPPPRPGRGRPPVGGDDDD